MYKLILIKNLIVSDFKPSSVMKMLKFVCEERNKALQGDAKINAQYQLRDCLYIRDVKADMRGFMRTIKREVGGVLSGDFKECLLY